LLLRIENLDSFYGNAQALRQISLEVEEGELIALLGANGTGKTTLFRTISGLVKPKQGKIEFQGKRIDQLSADAIVKRGISHSPEGRRLFGDMTVFKNLTLGAYVRRKDKTGIEETLQLVFDLFPVLEKRHQQRAGTLSGGEQQMLSIGRALMANPKLLMLDEPSLGLAPMVISNIFKIIKGLSEKGITILLAEQNANMALKVADRGYVLESGELILSGDTQMLLSDERIKQVYLGA